MEQAFLSILSSIADSIWTLNLLVVLLMVGKSVTWVADYIRTR